MADAFGLAVNALTVLDIGRKFALLAWDIYNDFKHGIPGIASLEITSKDLTENASQLKQRISSPKSHPHDETDERIHQLAERCIEVAVQMHETLQGISMHTRERSKRRAVIKAFKYKWNEDEINAFQIEIKELREELMLNLTISLRLVSPCSHHFQSQPCVLTKQIRNGMKTSLDNQDAMVQEFAESRSLDKSLKERLDRMTHQQEGLGQLMVEVLSSAAASDSIARPDAYCSTKASLQAELVNAVENTPSIMQGGNTAKLEISPDRLARLRKQFIDIFRYDSMFDREAGVAEAHTDTLKWIFKDPSTENRKWDNFGQWLTSENQLYWITGKMGSGKSTLMKYISEELPTTLRAGKMRRCTPYLRRWGQDQPLFIATFYFWAGSSDKTRIQTSVEGLYRTLLTQILDAYPEASPVVSPPRWENLCLFNADVTPPGIKELEAMLAKAIAHVSSIARICFFIDGLDEFDGNTENLKDLVKWVKKMIAAFPVKFCVASRPWRVFEDALQDRPHLLMENFNFKDIQQYVWSNFHEDPNFRSRKHVEANFCDEILDEIVTKAEGVFLWVHVVCAHMLEAMSRGDLIADLRKILKALPVQMENLYGHILDTLEPRDRDQASKYVLLLQACFEPDALIFSFADDIGEDIEYPLKMSGEPLTNTVLRHRASELNKRLNSRCRGLLSLSMDHFQLRDTTSDVRTATVQYCHRSAKDYLTMRKVQENLIEMLTAPFDPHLRLCSAYLARWKCGNDLFETEKMRKVILFSCVNHAAMVTSEGSNMMVRVLDNLQLDFNPFGNRWYIDRAHFHDKPWFGGTMVSLAVVFGVEEYVRDKTGHGRGCVVRSSSVHMYRQHKDVDGRSRRCLASYHDQDESVDWPLLLDASLAGYRPRPEMVSLLLENGADPNLIIRGPTGEINGLDEVLSRLRSERISINQGPTEGAWRESLCLLLRYGAKPKRADVEYLREFIGEDVIHKLKLPHLGRHRIFMSKHFTRLARDGKYANGHE